MIKYMQYMPLLNQPRVSKAAIISRT